MEVRTKFKPVVIIQSYEDREANRQFSHKVVERRSTFPLTETLQDNSCRNNSANTSANFVPPPPPPPPAEENHNVQTGTPETKKTRSKIAPPVPTKYSTLSYIKEKNGYSSRPPPCPTPDYDTISINSNSNKYTKNENQPSQKLNDEVEMESLESFKLNNPSNLQPRPPNTYFNNRTKTSQLSNGSISSNSISGMKQRPVSVIIGQYPSGSLRKQPGKLDFLSNGYDDIDKKSNNSINSKFASELAYTLNRSNLKKRTESMENMLNDPYIKSQNNGTVTISLNNTLSKNFAKSTGNLNSQCEDGNSNNRVTINISSGDKKSDVVPNGILKNGNGRLS